MPFANNVFINCPFDKPFFALLRPLLFTIIDLGFRARIALESSDAGVPRIEKIRRLIRESRLSVHDISRIRSKKRGEYYRLNMPLELGLDLGCRAYGRTGMSTKRCLVLEAIRWEAHKGLSDLSGSDFQEHNNVPRNVVVVVRNWIRTNGKPNAMAAEKIWTRFSLFMAENYQALKNEGHSVADIKNLPVDELMHRMQKWVRANPPS